MALFGQDVPAPGLVTGGAALGDLLTGGVAQRTQGVYVDQIRKHGQAADAMWQARERRARALAREAITREEMERAGYAPQVAGLLSAVLASGDSPDLRRLGDFQDPADQLIDQQRREAMEAGDVPRYNRLTAVRTDKAYQPARVVAGNVLPDGVALGDEAFVMQPLPQTQAQIAQRQASGEAALIRAHSSQRTMTPPQAEARVAWIMAQGNQRLAKGESPELVDAWIRNEMAKAGLLADAATPLVTDGAVGVPVRMDALGGDAPVARPRASRAWSQAEVLQAIRDARRAVSTGRISVEEARKRLRDAGLHNAAERL